MREEKEREKVRIAEEVRDNRGKEVQSYHINETLLDPVQCGSQSAADKAQTR